MQENTITFTTDEKEPLPSFNPTQAKNQDEKINFMPSESIIFEEPVVEEDPDDKRHPEIDSRADSIFGKALASTIMSVFPITSIIAIFLGFNSLREINKTKALADNYGVGIGGKGKAAKVLSMVGGIAGGAFTAYYTVLSLIVLFYIFIYCVVFLSQFIQVFNSLFQSLSSLGQFADTLNQFSNNMYYY